MLKHNWHQVMLNKNTLLLTFFSSFLLLWLNVKYFHIVLVYIYIRLNSHNTNHLLHLLSMFPRVEKVVGWFSDPERRSCHLVSISERTPNESRHGAYGQQPKLVQLRHHYSQKMNRGHIMT